MLSTPYCDLPPPPFTQVSSISFFSHFQTLFQSSKKNHKRYMRIFPKIRLQLLLDPIPNKGTKKTIRRNLSLNEDHSQAFNFVLMFSFSVFYTQLRIITVLLLCLEGPFTPWESHTVYSDHIHTLLLPVAPLRYVPPPLPILNLMSSFYTFKENTSQSPGCVDHILLAIKPSSRAWLLYQGLCP